MIELDLGHLESPAPLGLVPQTILERTARVLSDKELYRFRVVKLGERVQAHLLLMTRRARGLEQEPR